MSASYPKRFPNGMLDGSAVCPPALVLVDEFYEGTMSFYINPEETKKPKKLLSWMSFATAVFWSSIFSYLDVLNCEPYFTWTDQETSGWWDMPSTVAIPPTFTHCLFLCVWIVAFFFFIIIIFCCDSISGHSGSIRRQMDELHLKVPTVGLSPCQQCLLPLSWVMFSCSIQVTNVFCWARWILFWLAKHVCLQYKFPSTAVDFPF